MIGPILLFGGYCLVYAAVAKGGQFATDPWNGVFSDAYTESGGSHSLSDIAASTGFSPTSTLTPTPPASFTPASRPRGVIDTSKAFSTLSPTPAFVRPTNNPPRQRNFLNIGTLFSGR